MMNRKTAIINGRCGFALVTVLAFLALLVALVIGFLSRATTERSAAAGALSAASARQLADTAVSLVQGQINIATTQGSNVAWTSQPGMIRTFDSQGSLLKAYKLYSADLMISSTADITSDIPGGDWHDMPAIWTDLNAPVTDATGTKNYPILDGSCVAQGFKTTNVPVATGTDANSVPMPVKWLYILKDGTLVAPTGSGTTATISGETYTGTPNDPNGNPVVGRIAFWTDDETCKVNINTAAEGTYWDTPRLDTNQDWAFGNYQPAQKEFQAYPGHPATTCLSTVFPTLTTDQIYAIAPRVIGGGSVGGTQIATGALTPDKDRLYSSIDELMFSPSREANAGLSKRQLEEAKFFLTAHSRAPEVNLFNLPRVACWPVYEGLADDHVTAFDRLIAFCSTVNGSPYYFQRKDAGSPTYDIGIERNGQLYNYLHYLTGNEIPGFGGTFSAKYKDDRDQILTEIFDYIRSTNLYDDNVSVGNQFTKGRDTNSTKTPLTGHGWVVPTIYNNTMGFGRALSLSEFGIGFICNAVADVPSTTGTDQNESCDSNIPSGPGANAVLGGVPLDAGYKYIQAILLPEFFCPMQGYTMMRPDMTVKISGLSSLKITCGGETKNLFPVTTLQNGDLIPMDEATVAYSIGLDAVNTGRGIGGIVDWRYAIASNKRTSTYWEGPSGGKGSPARGNLGGDSESVADLYQFIGVPVKIKAPPSGGTMTFSGDLTVSIYAGSTGTVQDTNLIQTISIHFPSANIPVPTLATGPLPHPAGVDSNIDTTAKQQWWSFCKCGSVTGYPGRLYFGGDTPGWYLVMRSGQFMRTDCDVIRTVLPMHGDYRLVAGSHTVPNTVFLPRPPYYSETTMVVSNLSGPSAATFGLTDRNGKYFSDLDLADGFQPDIASEATAKQRPEATGDVDTGLSVYMDGPYINKPDEGNTWRGDDGNGIPYKDYTANIWTQIPGGPTFFSPNRLMPSPGMFGSLPTGVKVGTPWQTLLFRPQPDHPQSAKTRSGQPPDHLFLDLFWMPVVEPYAISDRFSTAGKINMNYQILPFPYIERSTGMRALLKSEKIAVVPNSKGKTYKKNGGGSINDQLRLSIDGDETLKQFNNKFDAGEVFKSASEICDLWIVPEGQNLDGMATYWKSHELTGDNLRERIYTTLYPRITTKSNTYTVHFRVQALRKLPKSVAGIWTENIDIVTGEYRGSTTIERFIDSNNSTIPNYAKDTDSIPTEKTLDRFYKWRVISNRQFVP